MATTERHDGTRGTSGAASRTSARCRGAADLAAECEQEENQRYSSAADARRLFVSGSSLFNTLTANTALKRSGTAPLQMANPAWAQVVRDVCARKPTEEEPQQSVQEDADLEEPLFASHTPANGLTPALQAIAAIIDEDDVRPAPSRPGKRKAESLGEAQVSLALTGLGAGGAQPQREQQRQRVETGAAKGVQP